MTQPEKHTPWYLQTVTNEYHAGSHHEGNKTIVTVATIRQGSEVIARCGDIAHAALIVKAVNSHAKLLVALKAIERAVNKAYSLEHGQACLDFVNEVARTAIAEAEGEA